LYQISVTLSSNETAQTGQVLIPILAAMPVGAVARIVVAADGGRTQQEDSLTICRRRCA